MAMGKAAEAPANSYLGQYLSRATPEGTTDEQLQQPEQHVEDTNPNGHNNNTNANSGERARLFRHGNDNNLHGRSGDDDGDDAHDAVPRFPPPGPTAQPPSPQRTQSGPRWTLDSATLDNEGGLERTSMQHHDLASIKGRSGGGGGGGNVCSTSCQLRLRQPQRHPQRQQDFMVDGDDMLRPGRSVAEITYRGMTTSANTRGQQQQQQQQQQSAGFTYATPHHHRLGGGLSKLSSAQGQQYGHQCCTDGDGRALSIQESSALFWEESDSLHAKSSCANNEWGLGGGHGRGGPGGRSTFLGATAPLRVPTTSAARGYSRASSMVAGGRAGKGGRGMRSVRDVCPATTAAPDTEAAIGGNINLRRKPPRAVLNARELPLGQALRTVGGLVGGDGAKVSAVGKHITSIEGVPSGVSSRATHLFLSNNSLRSLGGLESFSGVACLSLSHNLVRRTEDLLPLASLVRLETLSLEGNPVCGAANYRAHVVSLASPCLKTLDRREVTPAETTDAPAIVAAERSATSKMSKARCLCLLLDHMCGLLQCHTELREPLLRVGGGCGSDGISSRLRRPAGISNGWWGVWRQRPTAAMPVHQMLTVLRVEHWPAFDQSELEVLERQVLDEAVEVFAKVLASRRVASQRTHELSEGVVATLDSPGTRTWGQVLGEVHRRTEGNESDVVLRFEGVRRREAERFRHVSSQTNAFLQDLAAAVGYSDNQWSVPPCTAAAAAVVQQPIGAGARKSSSSKGPSVPVPPLQASPLLLSPALQGSGNGRAAPNAAVARSCPAVVKDCVTSRENCATRAPEVVHEREGKPQRESGPVGIDRSDLVGGHETRTDGRYFAARTDRVDPPPRLQTPQESERGAARPQSEINSGIERLSVVDLGEGQGAQLNGEEGSRERHLIARPLGPSSVIPRVSSARLEPSEFGPVTHSAVARAPVPASATDQIATTTMASAAKVLLAREEEQGQQQSGLLEPPPPPAAASQVTSLKEAVNARGTGARLTAEAVMQSDRSGGLLGRTSHDSKQEKELMQSRGRLASAAVQDEPNRRDTSPHLQQTRVRESSVRHETSTEPGTVLPGGGSSARPASSTGMYTPVAATATATAASADDLNPAAGQQHIYTPRQEGVVRVADGTERNTAGPKDEDGGGAVASGDSAAGDRRGSSSEATRRLLREALRVKRLLAAMDKADAAASIADNGLGGEDPEPFIASLGLSELKPLSARLGEALDRPPQALLRDPSVAGPEPRTTRGLRDQVVALGKEATQRAEACAEERKLHAALRKQIEIARRTRARNLDTVDVACRKLIAKAGEEVQVLHESRRVAHEAERYHATLACIQEQVDATIDKTRKIVSGSEAIAWQLREEMEGRGGELSDRRRVAEEGLAEWEQAAENDPGLSARRRAYECEILVLRHRMGCDGANNASLAAAFHLLRARVNQQRRAREWFARATVRREALLFRSVFDALARGSRSRAAEAAATAARCRAGLAAWKKAVSLSRKVRTMRWRRERATAVKGFQRWRQRCAWMVMAPGGGGVTEEEEGLEWRLELFRERRAKRVVFRAWREASQITAAVAVMDGRARGGITGRGGRGHRRGRYRGFSCFGATERDELTPCPSWGARLRAVEALACRRRFETQIGLAFRWWRRHRQCNELARTARQRRSLRCWRRRVTDARSKRETTVQARGSYVISLGRRVLAAWSVAAATRARRRTGAASLVFAISVIIKRGNIRRWAFQAAAAARETNNTVVALEYCYDRCLRGHLRAWSALARERRVLCRGVELLMRGRNATAVATGLRLWRRKAAKVREVNLRQHRIKAWAAAAARRRRLGMLSVSFSAWAGTRRRVAAIHSLTKWAAARRRRLALAGGFRALCLSGRRATITATATATAVGENIGGGRGDGDGGRDGRVLVVEASVQEAFAAKAAMEGKVGQLRARLAQQKARALERHATASEVAEEVARSERERARYAKILRRQVEQPLAPTSKPTTSAEEDTTGVGPGSLEEQLFPWGDGSTRKHGEEGEKGEGWRGILEPSRSPGGKMGLSELAEKEGELFGKLQAETLELRQVAAAAKKQEEQLRAEAARKSAVTTAALESALAEGNRLKEEAEQHKVLIAQLDLEAQHAVGQAADLSDRLAGAEQDLNFETNRNTERLRARDKGNARLRAAAAAAEKRVAVAENALRRKGREIEELRAKCAREGLLGGGRGTGGRRRGTGGGRMNTATSTTAGLEFRVFAAAAGAQSSVERCAVAAAERRVAAGSGLAEALRIAESEANTNRAEIDFPSDDDDDNSGGMAQARRLVADSVANERREVAGLVLRGAEAKLRRSADLSLRASLERRPLTNPRSLLVAEEGRGREKGGVTAPRSSINISTAPTPEIDIPDREKPEPHTVTAPFARDTVTAPFARDGADKSGKGRVDPRGALLARRNDDEINGSARTIPLFELSRPSSEPKGGGRSSNSDNNVEGIGKPDSDRHRWTRNNENSKKDKNDDGQENTMADDGLRELKREISNLEGKILGRLGGGGGDGGGGGGSHTSGDSDVSDSDDDRPTGRNPSGDGGNEDEHFAVAKRVKSSACATVRNQRRLAGAGVQLQQHRRQSVPPPSRLAASSSSLPRRKAGTRLSSSTADCSARGRDAKTSLGESKKKANRKPSPMRAGRTRRPANKPGAMDLHPGSPARVRGSFGSGSWGGISAVSSRATSASDRSRGSSRRAGEMRGTRSKSIGAR